MRTYSDASCNDNLGLSITVGTCYYKEPATIGSWRAACGSAASSSTDSVITISLTSTSSTVGSDTASARESSTTMMDITMTSMDTDVGPVLTSVEIVTPTMTQAAPPTDGAPVPTQMPTARMNESDGGNGTNWNMTHSKLSPTGSPGLQGTGVGSGMGTSGAGKGVIWKMGLTKALVMLSMIAGWQRYLL